MAELEQRGVATVCVASSVFRAMAQLEGTALGYSEARVVVVDHPIGGIDPEAVRAKADTVVDAVLAALTTR